MTADTLVSDLEGRKLDAAVASEVFGHDVTWLENAERAIPERDPYTGPAIEMSGRKRRQVPRYSSEPMDADTWSVVGEMAERGVYLRVGPTPDGSYWVNGWSDGTHHRRGNMEWETPDGMAADEIRADTAPLAICRAALKAVRE